MAKTADEIISLKVTLQGIRPPIWRRLLVPGKMTLGHLHEAIQAAMGWHGGHLHQFDIDGRAYGNPRTVDDVADQARLTLNGVLKAGVTRFTYLYDFGDNWDHIIGIEGKKPPVDGQTYPVCVAGKRNCPPEDCGGAWGYQDLLAILDDPSHPDRDDWIEMIDDDFDPEAFSLNQANLILSARVRKR